MTKLTPKWETSKKKKKSRFSRLVRRGFVGLFGGSTQDGQPKTQILCNLASSICSAYVVQI